MAASIAQLGVTGRFSPVAVAKEVLRRDRSLKAVQAPVSVSLGRAAALRPSLILFDCLKYRSDAGRIQMTVGRGKRDRQAFGHWEARSAQIGGQVIPFLDLAGRDSRVTEKPLRKVRILKLGGF